MGEDGKGEERGGGTVLLFVMVEDVTVGVCVGRLKGEIKGILDKEEGVWQYGRWVNGTEERCLGGGGAGDKGGRGDGYA